MIEIKMIKGEMKLIKKTYKGEDDLSLTLTEAKRLVEDLNKKISLMEHGFKCPNCHGQGTVLKYDEQEAIEYAKGRFPDTYMGNPVNCSVCSGIGRLEKEPRLVEKVVKEWSFD